MKQSEVILRSNNLDERTFELHDFERK